MNALDAHFEDWSQSHGLPRALYVDTGIYAVEYEAIVMRAWILAGHVSQIRRAGDHFLFRCDTESVIIVRQSDSSVVALADVSRRPAPHAPGTFAQQGHATAHLPIRVVSGLIFVSLSKQPLCFDSTQAALDECLEVADVSHTRIAHHASFQIEANWKLAVENFLECYHCSSVHPEYSRGHAANVPQSELAELRRRMHERAARLGGVTSTTQDRFADTAAPGEQYYYIGRHPLYPPTISGSQDGGTVAPLLGRFAGHDGGATFMSLGPFSYFLLYADHLVGYRFTPRGVNGTVAEVLWFVNEIAQADEDYDLNTLRWLWTVTSEQDRRIVESTQLGVASRFYRPGPYSLMEEHSRRFSAWYLSQLRAHRAFAATPAVG